MGDDSAAATSSAIDNPQKRKVPESDEEAAVDNKDKHPKTTINQENFKCSICLNIWHDVVSLSPCQHNFCNGCFSEWYRKSSRYSGCKCPQCRTDVIFASKNHTMRTLVEDLLQNNSSLKRSPEEIAKMDELAMVKSNFMKLGNSMPYKSDSSDDEDSEDELVSCRQCTANNSGFLCQPGASHLSCLLCYEHMPDRADINVPLKCAACSIICCDAYWRSQNVSSYGEAGCRRGRLQPMTEREIAFPREVHQFNTVEQEFTKQYLVQKGLSVEGVVRDWMIKVDNSECDLPGNMQQITSTSAICNACANKVVTHLLEKFRRSIPKTEMPTEAAARDDCWYGYACRTQRHNVEHAKKLNHICEPTSRNVVV